MITEYIIYSTRAQGWVNTSGNFGTERSKARIFDREAALNYCRTHVGYAGFAECFPVELTMMEEVEKKS